MKKEAGKLKIVFPESGITLYGGRVSSMAIARKLNSRYPEPEPPQKEVEMAPGRMVKIDDDRNEHYLALVRQHRNKLGLKVSDAVLKRFLDGVTLDDDQKAKVKELGLKIGTSDDADYGRIEEAYLFEIAIQGNLDYAVYEEAVGNWDISPEEVEKAMISFRGDV